MLKMVVCFSLLVGLTGCGAPVRLGAGPFSVAIGGGWGGHPPSAQHRRSSRYQQDFAPERAPVVYQYQVSKENPALEQALRNFHKNR